MSLLNALDRGLSGRRPASPTIPARPFAKVLLICHLGWLGLLCGTTFFAQSTRDDWKQIGSPFDLQDHLTHSLRDAPLTSTERTQIYRVIDDKTIHDSFTDDQRQEERDTVLRARVGSIDLADDGSRQILVQGPAEFCGATGNCSLWVFVRRGDRLQLALAAGGGILIIKPTSHRGFHDVATGWHTSAFEEVLRVYCWNGAKYAEVDCYSAKLDQDPPTITDCPLAP